MFSCDRDHRRYLRFLWHDIKKSLVKYQMMVYDFSNTTSPAVATYCLHKSADDADAKYGIDIKSFVHRNFYVYDALNSQPTDSNAVNILY